MSKALSRLEQVRNKVLAEMTPAAKQVCESIQKRLKTEASAVIRIWHTVGLQVEVMLADEEKYGADCVEQVATVLDLSSDRLYECRDLASKYSKEDIDKLLERVDIYGKPISYSDRKSVV